MYKSKHRCLIQHLSCCCQFHCVHFVMTIKTCVLFCISPMLLTLNNSNVTVITSDRHRKRWLYSPSNSLAAVSGSIETKQSCLTKHKLLYWCIDQDQFLGKTNVKKHQGWLWRPTDRRKTVTARVHIFPLIISIRLAGIENIAVASAIHTYAFPSVLTQTHPVFVCSHFCSRQTNTAMWS